MVRNNGWLALSGCSAALSFWLALGFGDHVPLCVIGWTFMAYVVMVEPEGLACGTCGLGPTS